MTLLASWQGSVNIAGGRVAAWFDAGGTMSVRVDGVSFTGGVASASNGYITRTEITGLAPGTKYVATIYLDGVKQGTQPVWTAKTSGPTCALWMSCSNSRRVDAVAMRAIRTYKPDLIFWIGDTVYHENAPALFGVTRIDVEADLANATATSDAAWNANRFFLLKPSFQAMARQCPVLLQWDDHDILADWRNDFSEMTVTYPWMTTSGEMTQAFQNRRDIASAVIHAATSGSTYYYAFDYNDIRFIVPDLITEKQVRSTGDMISAAQMTWLLAQLDGSKPFTFIMSSKSGTNGNADGWYDYGGIATGKDLGTIVQHIHDNAVTTVAWLCGDLHKCHVQYEENPLSVVTPNGGTPYLSLCACPMSQFFTDPSATTGTITYERLMHAVGVVTVNAERTEAVYKFAALGELGMNEFWTGKQLAGDNALVYATTKKGG